MPGGKIDILVEPDLTGFPGKLQAGLQASSGAAAAAGRGIGLAITAGLAGAAIAFREIIQVGNEYQGKLNEIQAVTGATADTMGQVASTAKALGSDLTLSGVSAADAAGAMLELAKGGLTVDEAMAAAKGTLQLAGAAQIDGARAAEIQAQALNQFGLAATDAGRVADTLANTANAASGSIEDVALAMKYVGPVAASMSVSMEDTATAIGLLANNGIMADTAGTSLRGMLASLAAPSGVAKKGIEALGIQAFDSGGKFVGFRAIIDQLSVAQGRMSEAQFTAAAAMAFGREPLAAITALAREGGPAFDEMREAVGRQGGAAEVAAAKMQGLGGAMESFKSNAETVAISLYELVDGPLEALVRSGTAGLDALNDGLSRLGSGDIGSIPGVQIAVDLFGNLQGVLENVRRSAEPVVTGVMDVVTALGEGGGAAETFGNVLRLIGDAAEYASGFLVPIGEVVGDLLGLFADLPGPVQAAALAWLAWRFVPGLLSGISSELRGTRAETEGTARSAGLFGRAMQGAAAPVTGIAGALRQFNDEARVQRALAAATGQEIGRLAGYQAAFETSTLGSVVALRSFRDEVRAVRDGAAGAGQPISNLSATMQVLADRAPAIGAMASSFRIAESSVSSFGATAGRVAGEATAAFGGRLGSAISSFGDRVAALPGTISAAAVALGQNFVNGANRAAVALNSVGPAAQNAAVALGQGVAAGARAAVDGLRAVPGVVTSAATAVGTGLVSATRAAGDGLRQVATSAVEAGRAVGTGLRTGLDSAVAAARAVPGQMVAAGQAIGSGLRTGLDTAVTAARALPGQIVSAVSSIPGAVGGVFNRLGDGVATAFGRIGSAVDVGIGALGRFAGAAAGVGASAFTGLLRAGGSLVSFLGGPWGVALAGAGVLLSVLAENHAAAQRAAEEQKAAMEALRGTLDQYTGAVTQATIVEKANQLAKDGTLKSVQQLGISTQDYVRAALGEEDALRRVQGQLDAHTQSVLGASREYQQLAPALQSAGISMADFTSAANGNEQAATKIRDAIRGLNGETPQFRDNLLRMFNVLMDNSGASAALAAQLGITNGQLAEIQEQTRLAAEASGQLAEQLSGVKAQIDAVPDAKEITIESTSPQVIEQLRALGFEVTQLKDGTVRVNLEDAEARAKFDALMVTLNTASAAPVLDLNTATATEKANGVKTYIDGLVGIATADANTAPGTEKANGLKAHIDGITAILTADANPAPGTEKANQLQAHINGLVGIMTADANNAPGTAKGDALRAYIDGLLGIMTAQANTAPGTADANALKAYIDRLRAALTVNSNAAQVNSDINNAARDRTTTITIRYAGTRPASGTGIPIPQAQGGIVHAMHDGGVLPMARGGRLTPMRGGVAQFVKPNTWRVIGDRIRDDEAYIPINRSIRSRAIFEETARRMGYQVARMYADGGIARQAMQTASDIAARIGGAGNGDVVTAIAGLASRLSSAERAITVHMTAYNPQAEPTSTTTIRKMRDLKEAGLFGG